MTDWANFVIAVCAVIGVVATLIGLGFGYGAFRGAARASAENQKEATKRVFDDIKHLTKELQRIRNALYEHGILVSRDTQAGTDGRGVKVPR